MSSLTLVHDSTTLQSTYEFRPRPTLEVDAVAFVADIPTYGFDTNDQFRGGRDQRKDDIQRLFTEWHGTKSSSCKISSGSPSCEQVLAAMYAACAADSSDNLRRFRSSITSQVDCFPFSVDFVLNWPHALMVET